MALPEQLLSEMGALREPMRQTRTNIERLIDNERLVVNGRSLHWDEMRVDAAVKEVELSVEAWARESQHCEDQLLAHEDEVPDDADAVQARVGAFMMLHLTIAGDVARLLPFDDMPSDWTIWEVHNAASNLGVDLRASAQTRHERDEIASATDELLQDMSTQDEAELDGEDDEDEDDEDEDDAPEGMLPSGFSARADVIKEDLDEMVGDLIDEVVTDIVERAAKSCSAVLIGLAGGGMKILAELLPHLTDALTVAPDDVRQFIVRAAKRITRLVKILVARAQAAMNAVLDGYRSVVGKIIQVCDPASFVTESLAGNVIGKFVHSKDVRRIARQRLRQARRLGPRQKRLRALKKTHQKWVGPVRLVAKGLPHLWSVPAGPIPVPAAPVAAVALLGWSVAITGDQLDSRGYLDLWKGVIRRASGE